MNNSKKIVKEISFNGKNLSLETGVLGVMANMAVKATYGETVVYVTAVAGNQNPDLDFFPLTVNYEERLYASGLIKNSKFIKRDGRAGDDAVVTKRLVDHAIRPLFPKDFTNEVQVVATVMSLDDSADAEFLTMIGASAALMASDIPWHGPMTSLKVGYKDGEFIVNPDNHTLHAESELKMMVSFAGEDRRFLAIEAEVNILPEDKVLSAIEFARNNCEELVKLINDFAKEVNPDSKKMSYKPKVLAPEVLEAVKACIGAEIEDLMRQGFDKTILKQKKDAMGAKIEAELSEKFSKADISAAKSKLEEQALRKLILDEKKRPDGRNITQVREINTQIGLLPRAHGSALFSRGVTQVLTAATLGSPSLELFIQNMYGERTKRYIHYYNFPPSASGEVGRIGGAGSREIGHGMLAERALIPVIPDQKEFPYTIILVSETLASSGSSSMASACASSMALMDAGVPIKDMVGGVGVGLIVNEDETEFLIMTDLAYMEDAFGFLDFKMTGTRTGVTAIQADMKSKGIPMSLLPKIFEQSKEGRMIVLDEMEKTIKTPKTEVSKYAPKMYTIKIDPDKIGMVIGSGGKTIKEIQETTDTELSIEDDGTIIVSSTSEEGANRALAIIDGMTREVKPGEIYDGVVKEIVDFGAFVEILPGKDGLLHVSEIAYDFIKDVHSVLSVGDTVKVQVLESRDGKVSLSKKALEQKPADYVERERPQRPDGPRRDHGGGRDRGNRRFR